jgi:cation:H+ antiporter
MEVSMVLLEAWLALVACGAFIGFAGPELSRSGDIIADKTGLSGNWIGLILLGTVTSLPELVTGISSVTVAHAPDIAVGDVFGSCIFNLLILVPLDFLHRETSVYRRAHQGHILSAGFGVMLIGFAGLSMLVDQKGMAFQLGDVGLYTPIIIGIYVLAMRTVFSYERDHREAFVEGAEERYPDITMRSAIVRYCIAAAVVVGAGIWLPFAAAQLAERMGWGQSFVGSLFVGAITSLPELVVTVAALRIGAVNMAIANLLGSNLFDILILGIDDVFYRKGPILADVSPAHAISAGSALVMSGLVIVSLLYRPHGRVFRTVGWTSLGLFTLYLFNSYVIYLLSK